MTRITNRLIISGLVWREKSDKLAKRNNVIDASTFLNYRFGSNYMIWNLAGSTSQGKFDFYHFSNQILSFTLSKPSLCTLKLLLDAVRAIDAWFSLNDSYVAIIQDLNGECSALVAACWLVYAGLFHDGLEALEFVCSRRKITSGVTIQRFAQYFANMIANEGELPNSRGVILQKIVIHSLFNINRTYKFIPGIEIYQRGELIFKDSGQPLEVSQWNENFTSSSNVGISKLGSSIIFKTSVEEPLFLEREVQIKISLHDAETKEHMENLCKFSFHTGYMPHGVVRIGSSNMEWSFEEDAQNEFSMELDITPDTSDTEREIISYSPFVDRSILKNLSRLVVHHIVLVNEVLLSTLLGMGHGRVVGMIFFINEKPVLRSKKLITISLRL